MASKLSLLLILMLLQTYGSTAVAIERFSIRSSNGEHIFVKNGKKVGHSQKMVKKNVMKITYKEKNYFMKDAKVDDEDKDNLELQDKIKSIIASNILNNIFKGQEKRYPLISLAFNPDYFDIDDIDATIPAFFKTNNKLVKNQ